MIIHKAKTALAELREGYIYQKFSDWIEEDIWKENFEACKNHFLLNLDEKLNWVCDLSEFMGAEKNDIYWLKENLNKPLHEAVDYIVKVGFVKPILFPHAENCLRFYVDYTNAERINFALYIFPNLDNAIQWVC